MILTMKTNKVVLITGSSSGIGAGLVHEFLKRDFNVCLFARRKERLESLVKKSSYPDRCLISTGDVTQPDELSSAIRQCIEKWGRLDITVANAGFAVAAPVQKLKIEDYRRQFETNVFGVLNTYYAAHDALTKSKGIFVVMGSIAGHVNLPWSTPYCMSKAAVRALSRGLQQELTPKGVSVVLISPGFVESEIGMVNNEGMLEKVSKKQSAIPKKLIMPTELAAKEMVDGILKRKREVVITTHGKFLVAVNRISGPLADWFTLKNQSKSQL